MPFHLPLPFAIAPLLLFRFEFRILFGIVTLYHHLYYSKWAKLALGYEKSTGEGDGKGACDFYSGVGVIWEPMLNEIAHRPDSILSACWQCILISNNWIYYKCDVSN
jgi:hypothetical protein